MKPSFTLIHVECTNIYADSVCHIILIPVENGILQDPKEFIVNPHADFEFVMSGLTRKQIEESPDFEAVWPQICNILQQSPFVMSSAEGYAIRSLTNTIQRLKVKSPEINYINAKAICRRTMDLFSYNLYFLVDKFFDGDVHESNPIELAQYWAKLALLGLESSEASDFPQFAKEAKIKIGSFSSEEFNPSLCIRDYSKRIRPEFDPDSVDKHVDPDNPFFGENVVFTGKMEAMTREEARTAVVAVGGFAPDRLTMDTNYLVVGKQDLRVVGEKGVSGKMKKAAEYKAKGCSIEVIDETEFLEALGHENIFKKTVM